VFRNPITGDSTDGTTDPLGGLMPPEDAYATNPNPDYFGMLGDRDSHSADADPFEPSGGCTLDGIPRNCDEVMGGLNNGSIVVQITAGGKRIQAPVQHLGINGRILVPSNPLNTGKGTLPDGTINLGVSDVYAYDWLYADELDFRVARVRSGVPFVRVLGARYEQDPSGRPVPCDVTVPTDSNLQAAVAAIIGEGTSPGLIGKKEYKDGDKIGNPTGQEISGASIFGEALNLASIIFNRAKRDNESLADVVKKKNQFLGYPSGVAILGAKKFGEQGSVECERLRRAVSAVDVINNTGPWNGYFSNRAVVQEDKKTGRLFLRQRGNAFRLARTDFF